MTLERRFRARVRVAETRACWLWTGGRNPEGYGLIWAGVDAASDPVARRAFHGARVRPLILSPSTRLMAHRVAWALAHESTPNLVLHRCDNHPCCNPAHLFDGDDAANMRDRDAKGRGAHQRTGAPAAFRARDVAARLTSEQIDEIRSAPATLPGSRPGYLDALAARFGVSKSTIVALRSRA